MLISAVDHNRAVADGLIQKLMVWRVGLGGGKIRPPKQDFVVWVLRGIFANACDHQIAFVRCDALRRGRQVEAVQRHCPKQQMQMRIEDPRYHCAPMQVNELSVRTAPLKDLGIGADCIDACAARGNRLGPGRGGHSRVNVTMDIQDVARHGARRQGQSC